MANQNEDYVAEFKARYSEMKNVQGLIAKLSQKNSQNGEESLGWSQGRDGILQRQFKGKPDALMAALAEARPDVVDGYASGQMNEAYGEATDYFGKNKGTIIGAINPSQLEELALSITPVKLGDDHPKNKVHNPAVKLVSTYQEVVGMNNALVQGEVTEFAYREYMTAQVNDHLKAISSLPVTDRNKSLFSTATSKLTYSSTGMAQFVGREVVKSSKKAFTDYFAEQAKTGKGAYTVADFSRNNLLYGPADRVMPLVGELLTAEAKKKKK